MVTLGGRKSFRDYDNACDRVKKFYQRNHVSQCLSLVLEKKKQYIEDRGLGEKVGTCRAKMKGVWEQLVTLDAYIDESDPDTELSQIQHAYQSAERARKDNQPRWFQLTCLIHDLGKVLALEGEPSHLVVGDTFPVGCPFSSKVIYPEYFEGNPDLAIPEIQSKPWGVYEQGIGLDSVHMSWGHDEYLYHVVRPYLPEEAAFIIRYHSFYAWHRDGAYSFLLDEKDKKMLPWLKTFNQYDLYSKADPPAVDDLSLRSYYTNLIDEYFPSQISW